MKREVQSLIKSFQDTLSGQPWFGRSVYEILGEINAVDASKKPGGKSHSAIELLYHMNTWAAFTLNRLEKQDKSAEEFEKFDWRTIDPALHNWEKGLEEYKIIHQKIITLLDTKTDDFLKEIVDGRNYNFRFLLNGLIQHNIYHLGQIAYITKL